MSEDFIFNTLINKNMTRGSDFKNIGELKPINEFKKSIVSIEDNGGIVLDNQNSIGLGIDDNLMDDFVDVGNINKQYYKNIIYNKNKKKIDLKIKYDQNYKNIKNMENENKLKKKLGNLYTKQNYISNGYKLSSTNLIKPYSDILKFSNITEKNYKISKNNLKNNIKKITKQKINK
jgi:hypothetical protein